MLSIFPNDCVSDTKLVIVDLIHPRTNQPASFALNLESCKVFEIQSISRGPQSNGSFLVGDNLFHHTELNVYTLVDPLLILLGPLTVAESGSFIDYIDCMNEMIEKSVEVKDGMSLLLQTLNKTLKFKERLMMKFCDSKCILDRVLVRLNNDKVLTYLEERVGVVKNFMETSGVYLVECSSGRFEIVALELIRSYIPENWYEMLVGKLGYSTDILFAEAKVQEEVAVEKKRPAPVAAQPTAKKQKDIAVAKSCMKMTSFFKPKGC